MAQVSQSRIKQSVASSAVPLGRVCEVLGKFPAAGSVGGAEGGGGSDEVGVQERDPLVCWNLGLHWKPQEILSFASWDKDLTQSSLASACDIFKAWKLETDPSEEF